jgi:hypothetical protein
MIFTKELIKKAILDDIKKKSSNPRDDAHLQRQKSRIIMEKTDFIVNAVQKMQNNVDNSVYFTSEELNELKQVLSSHFFKKLNDIGASNV